MSEHGTLDPQLAPAAQHLLVYCRITAETAPELYRSAVRGRSELTEYFRQTCDWTVEVSELAQIVRLHKRRDRVPTRRGPFLQRADRRVLAEKAVMVLAALVCEQLWRHQRVALRDLLQALSQVCAAEAASGRLPAFRIVAGEGVAKAEAARSRMDLLDALRLLLDRGLIEVDTDLDRLRADESIDLVIGANRDRLALEFASLSPVLLRLDRFPVEQHAQVLSAPTLLDADRLLPDDPTIDGDVPVGHNRTGNAFGLGPDERGHEFSDPFLATGGIGEDDLDMTSDAARWDEFGVTIAADPYSSLRAGPESPGALEGATADPESARAGMDNAATFDDAAITGQRPQLRRAGTLGRRQRAVAAHRYVLDDPGFGPTLDTPDGVVPYLQTSTGRERALTAAHAVGLIATVRRDWWQVDDPAGAVSSDDFPRGRRAERQGALALLDHVIRAEDRTGSSTPYAVTEDDIVRLFGDIRQRLPRWARGFSGPRQLRALARAAAAELVTMCLLEEVLSCRDHEGLNRGESQPRAVGRTWRTTPGIYLWKVTLGFSAAATAGVPERSSDALDGMPSSSGAGGVTQKEPTPADLQQAVMDDGTEAGRTDLV